MGDRSLIQPLIKKNPQTRVRSYASFNEWRFCEAANGGFSMVGLVLAFLDYEYNYSPERNNENCDEGGRKESLRLLIVLSTVLSVFLSIRSFFLKRKWKLEFAVEHGVKDYSPRWFGNKQLVSILILLVFPYPFISGGVSFANSMNFQEFTVCYTWGDFLYFFMFLRLYMILSSLFNYTLMRGFDARAYGKAFHTHTSFYFTFKCLLHQRPLRTVVFFIVIPMFLLFGILVRIWERPPCEITGHDFHSLFKSVYFIVISLATVGYGDYFPVTNLGCLLMMISTLFGAFLFSLMIVSLEKHIELSLGQKRVFNHTMKSYAAASCIQSVYRYYIRRKYNKKNKEEYRALKENIEAFKHEKEKLSTYQSSQEEEIQQVKKTVTMIEKTLRMISLQMGQLVDTANRTTRRSSLK